jgi:hypothetical protein
LNRERILGIRAADYEIGRHPPPEDVSWPQLTRH